MKTITKFSSPVCPPCKQFQPVWEQIKSEFPDIEFEEVDVSSPAGKNIAVSRGIRSVPSYVSTDGFRASGLLTKEAFIETFLKNEASGGWVSGTSTTNQVKWLD